MYNYSISFGFIGFNYRIVYERRLLVEMMLSPHGSLKQLTVLSLVVTIYSMRDVIRMKFF